MGREHAATAAEARSLIGRRRQLATLTEHFRSSLAGAGSLVLIGGEAGAGKSRLVTEFCSRLAPEQARYAVGQCLEYVQSPFAPFLAALSTLSEQAPDVLRGESGIRSMLARLLPQFETAQGDARGDEPDRLRQFNALAESFRRFGADRTTVIVLEDAQWADSASLDVLLHIVPSLPASRLLFLVTYRGEDLKRGHRLRGVLAKLERNRAVARMMLDPLDDSEIHALIFHALDGQSAPPAAVISAICARAEGNPLFAEELLKTMLESDGAHSDHVPATLREAILERLASLDDDDRSVLVHAAAIGRRFDVEFLADIVGRPVARVMPALKRAIELRLIVEEGGDTVLFAFRHELTRQVISGELLAAEARPLHRRIAGALEALAGEHTAELAYHWWQAHDQEKASRYNEYAGDEAVAVFAYRDALVNYERALGAGTADPLHRAALQEKLAGALFLSGFGERALAMRESALAYYESVGDRARAAAVCLEQARSFGGLGDTVLYAKHAERALDLIGDDTANPAFFEAHLVFMRLYTAFRWDPAKAQEHATQAERATAARATPALIQFFEMRMNVNAGQGNAAQALEDARRGATLAGEAGDWRAALRCWGNFAEAMAQTGERVSAIGGYEQALAIIEQRRITGLTPSFILVDLALAHLNHGELHKAAELIEPALAETIDLPIFRMRRARVAIPLGLALERDDWVRRSAQKDLADLALRSSNVWMIGALAVFAEMHVCAGAHAEGRALVRHAVHALEAIDAHPAPGDLEHLLILTAELGAPEDVMRARAWMERIAATSSVRATAPNVALFEAHERARASERAGATAKALEAAAGFREIGWPLHEARALEIAGEFKTALDIYQRTGDIHDARRLDAVLNPVNRRGRTKGELTGREREICDLLVQGKSNKAIAEALVISERTVETHVSSVLTKMEAGSRAELTAKLKS